MGARDERAPDGPGRDGLEETRAGASPFVVGPTRDLEETGVPVAAPIFAGGGSDLEETRAPAEVASDLEGTRVSAGTGAAERKEAARDLEETRVSAGTVGVAEHKEGRPRRRR
ncbi:hypothetical protein [Nannocystis pusilla]|uniref:hypothetical protein n=1 Tax=Nannocystis pusilla TaxID=889268 RepID=UPI003B779AEA